MLKRMAHIVTSPYITGNILRLDYKVNRLMLFGGTVAVYCENHTEHTDTLFGQNAEFYYVKAGGIYSNHWTLKGYLSTGTSPYCQLSVCHFSILRCVTNITAAGAYTDNCSNIITVPCQTRGLCLSSTVSPSPLLDTHTPTGAICKLTGVENYQTDHPADPSRGL
jgi:hypothetical protein